MADSTGINAVAKMPCVEVLLFVQGIVSYFLIAERIEIWSTEDLSLVEKIGTRLGQSEKILRSADKSRNAGIPDAVYAQIVEPIRWLEQYAFFKGFHGRLNEGESLVQGLIEEISYLIDVEVGFNRQDEEEMKEMRERIIHLIKEYSIQSGDSKILKFAESLITKEYEGRRIR